MIAILMFSGRSQRFWPLKEKSLFPVCGTTLLALQIARLREAGIRDILLVGGAHNLAAAKKQFPSMTFVKQANLELGMQGALLSSLPQCKKEPVLVVSANDIIDVSAYRQLHAQAKTLRVGGLILARKVKTYFPGGYLSVKGKRITGIVEKPGKGNEPSSLINIVAHVHCDAPAVLKALKTVKAKNDDGYEQALDGLFREYPYEAIPYTGSWQAVKYPWHLLDLLPSLLPTNMQPVIPKSCTVHRTAVIEGSVVLGENVRVMAHASIIGPCFVSDDTIIANNALVRGSSVGRRCVIGYNTEVARSILADDVWTHSSYLGDSVLGSDISLGAGTTTGNLRFDEAEISSVVRGGAVATGRTKLGAVIGDHVRTGIHVAFAPGVKIGERSWIHAKELVMSDVADASFVKDGTVRKNNKHALSPADRMAFRSSLQGKSR